MADHNERRRADRLDAKLKLEVKLSKADGSVETATLETINISTSGIYFKSDHFIEPMTKLAMELEVRVPVAESTDEVATAPPGRERPSRGARTHARAAARSLQFPLAARLQWNRVSASGA